MSASSDGCQGAHFTSRNPRETARSQKNIHLELDFSPMVPEWVEGDSLRLQQVLINLVGNAIKFTTQGHVKVIVAMAGEQTIQFHVQDSGIGISPGQMDHIFSPFTQDGSCTSRKYGGSGLGLTIVKKLVDMMGGTIGVDSQKGQGTTFTFSYPLPPHDSEKMAHDTTVINQNDTLCTAHCHHPFCAKTPPPFFRDTSSLSPNPG